jgi:hypothetical protein
VQGKSMLISSLVVAAALALGGCPSGTSLPDGVTVPDGAYWVEYQSGSLKAYAMPRYAGDAGAWYELPAARPTWYTGAALYEVADDGSWSRLTNDTALSLDDLIQVWDAPPRVEAPRDAQGDVAS